MTTNKAHARRSRHKHIDYAIVRRLLATGATQYAVAAAVGSSLPCIAQWVSRNRSSIAAAEKSGRTARRQANTPGKSGRGRNGGQGNVRAAQ